MKPHQNGNVLFLILIAVVLFAALSYAVTQSSRGGGNIDEESLRIESAQLLQYFTSIKHAVLRMKLVSGCADDEITFYGDGGAKPECGIFNPLGGNIPVAETPKTCCGYPIEAPIKNYDIPISNDPCGGSTKRHIMFRKLWIKGIGEDYEQDLVISACGVPDELCEIMGVYNSTSGTQASPFVGTFDTVSTDPSIRQLGFFGDANLAGQELSCSHVEPTKRFNMVVLAR